MILWEKSSNEGEGKEREKRREREREENVKQKGAKLVSEMWFKLWCIHSLRVIVWNGKFFHCNPFYFLHSILNVWKVKKRERERERGRVKELVTRKKKRTHENFSKVRKKKWALTAYVWQSEYFTGERKKREKKEKREEWASFVAVHNHDL